jgi:hypothetical protein
MRRRRRRREQDEEEQEEHAGAGSGSTKHKKHGRRRGRCWSLHLKCWHVVGIDVVRC